jgi:hypothetical protein
MFGLPATELFTTELNVIAFWPGEAPTVKWSPVSPERTAGTVTANVAVLPFTTVTVPVTPSLSGVPGAAPEKLWKLTAAPVVNPKPGR